MSSISKFVLRQAVDPYLKSVCTEANNAVARMRTQIAAAESFIDSSEIA